jgi:hypothetical protein
MAKEKLPRLTEAQVRKLANAQSFERGVDYYYGSAIFDTVRQGLELRARCEGSEYEPYEVSVTLDEDGVAEGHCSCPYEYDLVCKHIVALLLTYVHEPESFLVVKPPRTALADYSKEEVVEMIGKIVGDNPKVMAAVKRAAKGVKPGKAMDAAAYRAQARRAMRSESPRVIERELKALRDAAARMAKSGDWLKAGAVYHVALDEAVKGYDEMVQEMDYDGDICIVMDELAEGLGKCLAKSAADAKTRWAWIETMLEAELKDIELGGIDLAPAAGETVLKLANDKEWARVEERLRAAATRGGEWKRESLIRFLTEGLERRKRAGEADDLIRELGTSEQKTYLLIREGQIAEAMKRIKRIIVSKPGLVTGFADALVEAGAKQEALALVTERGGQEHWNTRDWLAKYYRKHGTPQQAVEAQRKAFLASPTTVTFKSLREVSRKAGNWDETRADVLAELEREGKIGELIEIALDEKDVARALALLPLVKEGSGWFYRDYKWEVARAAEKSHPREAIALYQQVAERTIGHRTREQYRQAADELKRVKKLYDRIGAQAEWEAYAQKLRAQYANLPALLDELRRARL